MTSTSHCGMRLHWTEPTDGQDQTLDEFYALKYNLFELVFIDSKSMISLQKLWSSSVFLISLCNIGYLWWWSWMILHPPHLNFRIHWELHGWQTNFSLMQFSKKSFVHCDQTLVLSWPPFIPKKCYNLLMTKLKLKCFELNNPFP